MRGASIKEIARARARAIRRSIDNSRERELRRSPQASVTPSSCLSNDKLLSIERKHFARRQIESNNSAEWTPNNCLAYSENISVRALFRELLKGNNVIERRVGVVIVAPATRRKRGTFPGPRRGRKGESGGNCPPPSPIDARAQIARASVDYRRELSLQTRARGKN